MTEGQWISRSAPYLSPQQGDTWAKDAEAQGRRGTQRVTFAGEVQPPGEVARLLRLNEGDTVVARRRIMYLDGQPCELTDSYYPPFARGTPLAEKRKIPGGAVTLLAALGRTGVDVEEDVAARPPTDEERQALSLPSGDWVLVLTRRTAAGDGSPVEVSVMTMPATQRKLQYRMKVA